jgi:hypothetical protein
VEENILHVEIAHEMFCSFDSKKEFVSTVGEEKDRIG